MKQAAESQAFRGSERFSVVRELGAGGMGTVYEAEDRRSGQRVALKALHQLTPEAIYRLKREFRSLSSLLHPHLVQLYELVAEGPQWFFTMELVDGATDLRSAIVGTQAAAVPRASNEDLTVSSDRREPSDAVTAVVQSPSDSDRTRTITSTSGISQQAGAITPPSPAARRMTPIQDWERVRRLFLQLAQAVACLHQAGRLHRDLKPGNVVVDRDDRLVVLDFGLVAELDRHGQWKGGEEISGTLRYMAPEQFRGGNLGPAADWYAVGVMLFEILTGRMPFLGSTMSTMWARVANDGPAPSQVARGIPEDLDLLCHGLLRCDAGQRMTGEAVLALLSRGDPAMMGDSSAIRSPFLGRTDHLRRCAEVLTSVRDRASAVIGIHGPSGTGKSTLAAQVCTTARNGHAVIFHGRCYQAESVPFKGVDDWVDALTQRLLSHPPMHLPPGCAALARIFPVLRRIPSVAQLPEDGHRDADHLRRDAFSAFIALLTMVAAGCPGLVLHLDDVQWGDEDTAAILTALFTAEHWPGILVLMTWRSEDRPTSPCLNALFDPSRTPVWTAPSIDLPLAGLSRDESRELALSLVGDLDDGAALVERLVSQSAGSPFLLAELARSVRERGADSLGDVHSLDDLLWSRIERLPSDARSLLEVSAVAGQPMPLPEALRAAALPPIAPRLVAGLVADRLLRASTGSGDGIETYHDRIRETILSRLDGSRLRDIHLTLAGVLAGIPGIDQETIAVHLLAAGERRRAAATFIIAAEHAARSLAASQARRCWQQAIACADDPIERARAQEGLIHTLTDAGQFREAYDLCRSAAAELGASIPETALKPRLLLLVAKVALRLRGRSVDDLLHLPSATDPDHEALVRLLDAGAKAAYQVSPERCVAVSATIVDRCLSRGVTADCAVGFLVYGTIFRGAVIGNVRLGEAWGALSLQLAERFGNRRLRAELAFVAGYFALWRTKGADAVASLWHEALLAGREEGDAFHCGCAQVGLALLAFLRGAPLSRVVADTSQARNELVTLGQDKAALVLDSLLGVAQSLLGEEDQRHDPSSGTDQLPHFALIQGVLVAWERILAGDAVGAAAILRRTHSLRDASPGMPQTAEHAFLSAVLAGGRGADARRIRQDAILNPGWFRARWQVLEALTKRGTERDQRLETAYTTAVAHGQWNLALLISREAHRGQPVSQDWSARTTTAMQAWRTGRMASDAIIASDAMRH